MKRYQPTLLLVMALILLTDCASYFDYRGNVIVSVAESGDDEYVSTYSYECFFATFSLLSNTSSLPFYDIGTSCNETEVRSRLANLDTANGFIALAVRGSCFFTTKTEEAVKNNAKGLIVYNTEDSDYPFVMGSNSDYVSPIPVVSVSLKSGTDMLEKMRKVTLAAIDNNHSSDDGYNTYSAITFSIFIGLTCVVLLVVLIALFLTVYQLVCRCYSIWKRTQQEQEATRAIKRKLNEMKCSRYSVGEATSIDGLHDSCSVCLEEFQVGEVIRNLPCTHPFHKDCVDKWLYKKHSCPLCKYDILKGEHENTSEDRIPAVLEVTQGATTTTNISNEDIVEPEENRRISISSEELLIPLATREDTQTV